MTSIAKDFVTVRIVLIISAVIAIPVVGWSGLIGVMIGLWGLAKLFGIFSPSYARPPRKAIVGNLDIGTMFS